jgi:shikimate kinase
VTVALRPRRVFLIGMMGCGKSAVGSSLSPLVAWPHIDNDALLKIREGFDLMGMAGRGADTLHDAEAGMARVLAERPPPFIAGIAASIADRPVESDRINRSGLVVYLRAEPATLVERTKGGGRPWLDQDPLGWITDTLARRAPRFEAMAHLILDVDETPPATLAARIVEHLQQTDR